jgi:glycosyltransferase involved in cell wall biosynthesis
MRFTVFTPTYNRAHTLARVYKSLLEQPHDLFHWLVVDDGSTDGTRELICELQSRSPFHIDYLYQPNGGKHRAHNASLSHLNGRFTIILDSDDALLPNAIRLLDLNWQEVEQSGDSIAGIVSASVDEYGNQVGNAPQGSFHEGKILSLILRGLLDGEKLPCYRSEVLRANPFPERDSDNNLVPEGVIWLTIGEKFGVRCLHTPTRIYFSQDTTHDSLMKRNRSPISNPWGRALLMRRTLAYASRYFLVRPWFFVKSAANFTRFSLHLPRASFKSEPRLEIFPATLVVFCYPLGLGLYALDKFRFSGS